MAHGTHPTHMEDNGNQAGCPGCSELDILTKAQGDRPGSLNGERQAWQPHKKVHLAQDPSKKRPSHQGKWDKEEVGGRLERETVVAALEKGSSFPQIQSRPHTLPGSWTQPSMLWRKALEGRNTNNLRYAGDNITMAESEEELKNFLMRV